MKNYGFHLSNFGGQLGNFHVSSYFCVNLREQQEVKI